MYSPRVKVMIRCNRCGEKFVLRGRRENGRIDTGFKQCLCSNMEDFEIEEQFIPHSSPTPQSSRLD